MSTQPIFGPKARFFDSNGDPLSGGLLYTYSAGTTTALATYTTRAGDVANANPVVLDGNGEADIWGASGSSYKLVLKNSAGVTQWTVDNVPARSEGDATDAAATEPGGRLTLTSGTPVTTSDVTGATTVYYVPHKSDKVPLYDGSNWSLNSIGSSGLSQATTDTTKSPAAVANNSNYDMFVWSDSGTIRLSRGPAWTSDTARGTGVGTTELEQVNGRYVNKVSITNGPGAQRGLYVGTIRSDGSAQINDSLAKRLVWNMHNRVVRPMRVLETNASWNYALNSWRQVRASSANQLAMVIGISEGSVQARTQHSALGDQADSMYWTAIGLDSTTAAATGNVVSAGGNGSTTLAGAVTSFWSGVPGLGYHYLAWLERTYIGFGAFTIFYGVSAPIQSGILGELLG
jgi:hypothetical protein